MRDDSFSQLKHLTMWTDVDETQIFSNPRVLRFNTFDSLKCLDFQNSIWINVLLVIKGYTKNYEIFKKKISQRQPTSRRLKPLKRTQAVDIL